MPARTDLLVIGAGPYAYATAAYARDRGLDTHVAGHPMASWREQMPADMYLRSGPDWPLDATGEHTFAAFFEERGLDPTEHDPIPIGVFLDHTEWFAQRKGLAADPPLVAGLTKPDDRFVAALTDGSTVEADRMVAAPGVGYFAQLPEWHLRVPEGRRSHTSGFETSLPGLFVVGFAATRDFGPFDGFTAGCLSAARIVVDEMLR
ncbi:hypothetical protein [Nocardioides sp. T2.26MG-1]|uniref:hypothetical protein n=1 Tax=Nocardioides sp. T2.26MG-1 TaxID=3041166 RepID=UPI0024777D95|nr:hypothetical protein [Nocardioides sp. T2.26MG-1]CAI9414513.1 hypothetical protein HIDPHFAB_02289 [Nocardioides sp. T2.26MG-1]